MIYCTKIEVTQEKKLISLEIIQVGSTTNTCITKYEYIFINKLIGVTKLCTYKSFTMHPFSYT
jgi:hypothetical protein